MQEILNIDLGPSLIEAINREGRCERFACPEQGAISSMLFSVMVGRRLARLTSLWHMRAFGIPWAKGPSLRSIFHRAHRRGKPLRSRPYSLRHSIGRSRRSRESSLERRTGRLVSLPDSVARMGRREHVPRPSIGTIRLDVWTECMSASTSGSFMKRITNHIGHQPVLA